MSVLRNSATEILVEEVLMTLPLYVDMCRLRAKDSIVLLDTILGPFRYLCQPHSHYEESLRWLGNWEGDPVYLLWLSNNIIRHFYSWDGGYR